MGVISISFDQISYGAKDLALSTLIIPPNSNYIVTRSQAMAKLGLLMPSIDQPNYHLHEGKYDNL